MLGQHFGVVVITEDLGVSGRGERLSAPFLREAGPHHLGEGYGIAGGHEITILPLSNQISDAMDVGAYDGRAKRHRFHHDPREGLFVAGADKKIGRDEKVEHVTRFWHKGDVW